MENVREVLFVLAADAFVSQRENVRQPVPERWCYLFMVRQVQRGGSGCFRGGLAACIFRGYMFHGEARRGMKATSQVNTASMEPSHDRVRTEDVN